MTEPKYLCVCSSCSIVIALEFRFEEGTGHKCPVCKEVMWFRQLNMNLTIEG